jgi:nitroreductase
MTENGVEDYINTIADQRNIPEHILEDFKGMMLGTINNMTEEQKTIWAQKQTYIGLGFSLVASAVEEVDSTPMEGFVPQQVDEVLGLKELGLKSSVILTLGYRDTEGDSLSTMKKVRRDNLFIRK